MATNTEAPLSPSLPGAADARAIWRLTLCSYSPGPGQELVGSLYAHLGAPQGWLLLFWDVLHQFPVSVDNA